MRPSQLFSSFALATLFALVGLVIPCSVHAASSTVGSVTISVTPTHPQAGDELVASINVYGTPGRRCYATFSAAIPGLSSPASKTLEVKPGNSWSNQGVFRWTVPAGLAGGASLTPTISWSGCGSGSSSSLAPGTTPPTVQPSPVPALNIYKELVGTGAADVTPDDVVTYRLRVESVGTATADNVVLTDVLDGGLAFSSADTPGSHSGGATGGTVTWSIGDLAPGDVRSYELTTRVASGASAGIISNDFTATETTLGTRTSNSVDVSVHTTPKITLLKTIDNASDTSVVREAGRQVTYWITYTNVGPAAATNLIVTDQIPSLLVGPFYLGGGATSTYDANTRIASWNVGTVQPGESRVLTIAGQIDPSATNQDFDNVAQATYSDSLSNPYSATSNSANISVESEPYVLVRKEVSPKVVAPGDTLFYTVFYQNIGSVAATSPTITDTLPADVTYVANSAAAVYDPVAHTLTWNTLADLDPSGKEFSVSYKVTVNAGTSDNTTLVNEASFGAANLPGFMNAFARASAQVQGKANLVPSKSIQGGLTTVVDGSRVTYELSVANTGVEATTAAGVTLTDRLAPGLTFVSARGPGSCSESGGVVTCNTATELLPGANTGSFLITVDVDGSQWQDGDLIPNSFTATASDQYGRSFSEPSTPAVVQFNAPPSLSVVKTAYPAVDVPLQAGDIVSYFISTTLNTVGALSGVVVSDLLPPELELVSVDNPGATSTNLGSGGTLVVWPPQTFTHGSTLLSLKARVKGGLPLGQAITNQAAVSWGSNGGAKAAPITHYLSDAAMALDKTVASDQQFLVEGEVVTYRLRATNTGKVNLTGMQLLDALPAEVTFLDANPAPSNVTGGVPTMLSWSLGTLAPGSAHDIVVRATVKAGTTGKVARNQAFLLANEVSSESTFVEGTIRSAPSLSLSKSASVATAHPGETIEYTLTYINNGTGDAVNVELFDEFPSELTFVSASDGITPDANGDLIWSVGTLKPGASGTKLVRATVPSTNYPNPIDVDNNGFILSDKDGAFDDATVTLMELPAFTVTKSVDTASASPGETLHYTIDVVKTGGDVASGVVLTDSLHPLLSYVAGTSSDPLSAASDPTNGELRWDLGTMPAGVESFSVSFDVTLDGVISDGTVVDNTAHLAVSGLPGQNSNTVTTAVTSQPVLLLTKTASAASVLSAASGTSDTVTYTLMLENSGTDVATDVTLVDRLPAELTALSASQGGSISGQDVTWDLGDIPPGAPATATVSARVVNGLADGAVIRNTAVATPKNSGVGPVASNEVVVVAQGQPQLTLHKTPSQSSPKPGEPLTYTLVLKNTGTADSGAIVIEDQLPAEVSFLSATQNGAETASGSGIVRWNLPALAPGKSHTVTVSVELDSVIANGTTLRNIATAHEGGNTGTSVAAVPVGSLPVVTSAPFLTITKQNMTGASRPAGGKLTWEIVVTNTGSDTSTNVLVRDVLHSDMTLVTASKGYSASGSYVDWVIPSLPAKASASFTVTTRIDASVVNGKVLPNKATVTSSEQPLAKSAGAKVKVLNANYRLDKSADRQTAASGVTATSTPGDEIVYTLNFINTGAATSSSVLVEDILPADVIFLGAVPAPSSVNGQTVRWSFANVPPLGGGSIKLRVRVAGDLRDGLVLHNTATLKATGIPSIAATPADVVVSSAPRLQLEKTSQVAAAVPGQTISYDLTVTNTGSDTALSVEVADILPAELSLVSVTNGGVVSGSGVTWTLGALTPGASATVHLKAQLDAVLADGLAITNTATATGEDGSSVQLPSVSDSYTINISSAPILNVSFVTGPGYVAPGGGGIWTLRISNTGNSIATGVEVGALVPEGIQPQSIDKSGSFQVDAVTGDQYALWNIGSLPPAGYIDLTFSGGLPVGTPGNSTLLSLAAVAAANAAPAATLTTAIAGGAPALQFSKVAANSVAAGDVLDYRLDYFNAGNIAATNAVISDALPPNVTFVSADQGGALTGNSVEWALGNIPAGSGGSVNLQVSVAGGLADHTGIGNIAGVSADNNPPTVADVLTLVRSHTELDVGISPSANVVSAGSEQTFTVTWGNSGNQDTTGTLVTATLPPNTTLISASNLGTLVGNEVQWSVGSLAAGQSGTYTFTVRTSSPLVDGTKLKSVATITASSGLPNSATALFAISSHPSIAASKSASVGNANVGDTVSFDIKLQNIGNEDATGVVVTDSLPTGLEFVSASVGGVYDANTRQVVWTLGTLAAAGPEQTLSLVTRVSAGGTDLTNNAVISTNEVPDQQLSATVQVAVVVPTPVPALGGSLGWAFLAMLTVLVPGWGVRNKRLRI